MIFPYTPFLSIGTSHPRTRHTRYGGTSAVVYCNIFCDGTIFFFHCFDTIVIPGVSYICEAHRDYQNYGRSHDGSVPWGQHAPARSLASRNFEPGAAWQEVRAQSHSLTSLFRALTFLLFKTSFCLCSRNRYSNCCLRVRGTSSLPELGRARASTEPGVPQRRPQCRVARGPGPAPELNFIVLWSHVLPL